MGNPTKVPLFSYNKGTVLFLEPSFVFERRLHSKASKTCICPKLPMRMPSTHNFIRFMIYLIYIRRRQDV